MSSTYEREIKLAYPDAERARAAVSVLGAAPLRPRRLQSDTLFDNAGALSARRAVLRVRRDGGESVLTFKNPVDHATIKVREEIETRIADADRLITILQHLGYIPWFSYEKYREEFTHDGVIVAIDETPVGTFVELEGPESGIAAIAQALGREPADYVLESYRTLFVRYCAEHRLDVQHMLFALVGTAPR
jgi:adenylate cyclase, class 2